MTIYMNLHWRKVCMYGCACTKTCVNNNIRGVPKQVRGVGKVLKIVNNRIEKGGFLDENWKKIKIFGVNTVWSP